LRDINPAGLALIERFEGLRFEAYQDVAGIWTIGYGHTGDVSPGMTISAEQAQQLLQDDLDAAEGAVGQATADATTNDNQFSAMVSLCYNIGSGNFRDSTVLREHLVGDYQAAADAFLLWNKATINGALEPVPGLTARRTAERQLYLQPTL
jgi:lysozyme